MKNNKINKYAREWSKNNREKVNKYKRNYYKNNKKKISDYQKKYRLCNPDKVANTAKKDKIRRSKPKHLYSVYKNNAKKRGIYFLLEYSDFMSMWNKNCFYCNGKIDTIGIDRVDNEKGYTNDNIVPCCKTCNYMKNNLEVSKFLNHIIKIFNNIITKT